MKRLEIIVEGQTEQEFVSTILSPYFYAQGVVHIAPILLRTGVNARGGFVNYKHLRDDVLRSLHSADTDLVVTTFVDYFRLPMANMPEYEQWKNERNHDTQIRLIEQAIRKDIADNRFVPYIQKHEFEALLFASDRGFQRYYSPDQVEALRHIRTLFPNPEDINTSPTGAPSKRLRSVLPAYEKIIDGNILALEVGLEAMRENCPHFAQWLHTLEQHLC